MTRVRKKELGDWRENGSKYRDATKMQLPPREVHGELEREEQRLTKQRKHIAILRNDHTSRSSNSFPYNETLLSLLLHMDDRPKACAMPTNTNLHVSVQSKVIEIRTYACELIIIDFLNMSTREF